MFLLKNKKKFLRFHNRGVYHRSVSASLSLINAAALHQCQAR